MRTCTEYSELFLDHLYGLLDPDELRQLQEHLAACAQCQAAFATARSEQNLLAWAALRFREVPAFFPPVDEPAGAEIVGHTAPLTVLEAPSQKTAAGKRHDTPWVRWASVAVAACLLCAVGYAQAIYRGEWQTHKNALSAAEQEVAAVRSQLVSLKQDFRLEKESAVFKLGNRSLQVDLLGPVVYHPTAPASFRLLTRNLDGKPAPSQVAVKLVGRVAGKDGEQVLFSDDIASSGESRSVLPPNLPAQLGSAPRLIVKATSGDSEEELEQALRVEAPTYTTFLALNKSSFKIGENLFFRSVTLERFSLAPATKPVAMTFTLSRFASTSLVPMKKLEGLTQAGGIAGGDVALTQEFPEGEYLLVAAPADGDKAIPPAGRALRVYRDDRPQVFADRTNYQPGEVANFFYNAGNTGKGANAANQNVVVRATVDDKTVPLDARKNQVQLHLSTDMAGNTAFNMLVPPDIAGNKLFVEVERLDGKTSEKTKRLVPVAPRNLAVDFFPEGGALVAGVPCRVYCRLNLPAGLDQKVEGVIEDSAQKEITRVQFAVAGGKSAGQALGSFVFAPEFGPLYRLRLMAGGKQIDQVPLPPALQGGVGLTALDPVAGSGEPLRLKVRGSKDAELLVLATCRGAVVDQKTVRGTAQHSQVVLEPAAGSRGVIRVSVYEKTDNFWRPAAERLVYRTPGEHLKILPSVRGGQGKKLKAGDSLRVEIDARTEKDVPAAAWLHAWTVQADGDLAHQSDLPEYFYLTSELKDGEALDISRLVSADSNPAREELDLLLGTQEARLAASPQPTGKALATAASGVPTAFGQTALFHAGTDPSAALQRREQEIADLEVKLQRDMSQRRQELEAEQARAVSVVAARAEALAEFERLPGVWLRYAVAALLAGLLVLGAALLAAAALVAVRRRTSPRPYLVGAFAVLFFALILYPSTSALRTTDDAERTMVAERLKADFGPPLVGREEKRAAGAVASLRQKGDTVLALLEDRNERLPYGSTRASAAPSAMAGAADNWREQLGERQLSELDSKSLTAVLSNSIATNNRVDNGVRNELSAQVVGEPRNSLSATFQAQGGLGGFAGMPTKDAQALQGAGIQGGFGSGGGGGFAGGGGKGGQGVQPLAPGQAKGAGGGKPEASTKKASESKAADAVPSLASKTANNKAEMITTAVLRPYAFVQSQMGLHQQDTVLWDPLLRTNNNGSASVGFDLAGRPGAYTIVIHGHTSDGRLGSYRSTVEVGK
jgi:uncharacterized membrane protein YgcG